MLLVSRVDYHTIMDQAPVLYLIAIVGADRGVGCRPLALRRQTVAARFSGAFCRCQNWSS